MRLTTRWAKVQSDSRALPAYLEAAREELGLNWTTLAAFLGLNTGRVRDFMRGRALPQAVEMARLGALAEPSATDMALLERLRGQSTKTKPRRQPSEERTDGIRRILHAYCAKRGLDEEHGVAELASWVKRTERTVRRWLSGEHDPPAEALRRLQRLARR